MRLGLFTVILATLLLDIGLVSPIVVDTAPSPGSARLPAGSPVRCLRFSRVGHPYWPDLAVLDTMVANGPPELLWYRGGVRVASGDWVPRRWRPAGNDSLDLDWYGSYVRLPLRGTRLVGRTFEMYYDNLLEALRVKSRPVLATWIRCPGHAKA